MYHVPMQDTVHTELPRGFLALSSRPLGSYRGKVTTSGFSLYTVEFVYKLFRPHVPVTGWRITAHSVSFQSLAINATLGANSEGFLHSNCISLELLGQGQFYVLMTCVFSFVMIFKASRVRLVCYLF